MNETPKAGSVEVYSQHSIHYVDGDGWGIDSDHGVLHVYRGIKVVATFRDWEYARFAA